MLGVLNRGMPLHIPPKPAYTFAVRSDHPPSPQIIQPCRCFLNPVFYCSQQVTNRQHSGKPPLREVTASLGQSSATLRGAAREQYAAMEAGHSEAGGGAVETQVAQQSGRAASAGGHHGGPHGATRRSHPDSPDSGAARTLRPVAAEMTCDKKDQ